MHTHRRRFLIDAVSFLLPAASLPEQIEMIGLAGEEMIEQEIKLPTMKLKGYQAYGWALNFGRVDWFANPVLWIGFVAFAGRRWFAAGIAGIASLALSSLAFLVYNSSDSELGGTFLVGYWLWLAGMLVLSLVGWMGHWQSKATDRPGQKAGSLESSTEARVDV